MTQEQKGSNKTIVILLVVIIVLLGAIALYLFAPAIFLGGYVISEGVSEGMEQSKVENTKIQIVQLESGLKLFKVDNGFYPSTNQGLDALIVIPSTGRTPTNYDPEGYVEGKKVPFDQWGNEFIYLGPDQTGGPTYEIISFGPDGIPQTDDDISSRNIE